MKRVPHRLAHRAFHFTLDELARGDGLLIGLAAGAIAAAAFYLF